MKSHLFCLFWTIFRHISYLTSINDCLSIELNHLLNWISRIFYDWNNILNWFLGEAILNRILNESLFGKIQTLNWIRFCIAHPYIPIISTFIAVFIQNPEDQQSLGQTLEGFGNRNLMYISVLLVENVVFGPFLYCICVSSLSPTCPYPHQILINVIIILISLWREQCPVIMFCVWKWSQGQQKHVQ